MRLEIRRASGDLAGLNVKVVEYEPLTIRIFAKRDVAAPPNVLLDGAPIGSPRVTTASDELCWEWEYRSESWCGRSRLDVITDRGRSEIVINTVPSGHKYSEDEYDQMIDRLLAYNRDLAWGTAPGLSSVHEREARGPEIAIPSLVEYYLGPLLQQLQRILADPLLATFRNEEVRPVDPTRPLNSHTLRWLASHPVHADEIKRGHLDVLLPQQKHIETYDHPANRYVIAVVYRLLRTFERTVGALEAFPTGRLLGDQERARCKHLAMRLRHGCERLQQALDHPVLAGLEAGPMSEGVSQVFAGHPHYARFGRIARRLLSNGIELTATGALEASLRRSWDLFELYCLHRLVEVLENTLGSAWVFERRAYLNHLLCAPENGLFWTATHSSSERWELKYQEPFKRNGVGPSSITTGRQPDFVLCHYVDETLRSWVLVDAKYRSSERSLNDALESMHIYRDSLRWTEGQTALSANAGYLLVPCIADEVLKYATPDYLDRWSIGVIDIDDDTLGPRLLASSKMPRPPIA